MSDRRKYVLSEQPHIAFEGPATSCMFCKHCTDMFWDYTNGPYMFMCELSELDADTDAGYEGKCDKFEEGASE